MNISFYLSFAGNCREAMTFYQKCIGGKLRFQVVGDSPLASELPTQIKDLILHATLQKENLVLMASDMIEEGPLHSGNQMSLLIHCDNETEMYELYEKLSAEGQSTHPIQQTHWGTLFGGLIDIFGIRWWLNFKTPPTEVA